MNLLLECRPIFSSMMRNKTGVLLIAFQMALTLAVLCNALYIVSQRLDLAKRPSGAEESETFMIRLYPFREVTDVKGMQLADEAALRAIPGVKAVTWANQAPMVQYAWTTGLNRERNQRNSSADVAQYISPNSLIDTLGLKLIEGRQFNEADVVDVEPRAADGAQPKSVILTLAAAKQIFPESESFVGKSVFWGGGEDAVELTIIGIIERLQTPHAPQGESAEYSMIVPARFLDTNSQYLVRTNKEDRAHVMAEAERVLTELRNDRVLLSNRSLDEMRERRYRSELALSNMLIAVSVLMLLITASGIVGMSSLWVNQRRKQIGIRRALGALKRDIMRYFITENLIISSLGAVIGVTFALLLNHLLVSNMELSRLPVLLLAYGIVTVFVLGLLAVLGPAWRGASVPAAEATRSV